VKCWNGIWNLGFRLVPHLVKMHDAHLVKMHDAHLVKMHDAHLVKMHDECYGRRQQQKCSSIVLGAAGSSSWPAGKPRHCR
jgi:hypothetical protein